MNTNRSRCAGRSFFNLKEPCMGTEFIVKAEPLKKLIEELYLKTGMSDEDAKLHADGLVTANLRGVDSHGVLRTKVYFDRFINGAVNMHPDFRLIKENRAIRVYDADRASGYVAAAYGMRKAIELAKEFGLGSVHVINSNHFGACAYFSQMAVDAGMLGFCATNTKAMITAPGAKGNATGNNPFALGIPTFDDFVFMLDMAQSVVAGGKLKMAAAKGEKIPLTWATDIDGNPTDDPVKGFQGFLLPAGGYKGLGIAYAIDILCGLLSGGCFQNQVTSMFEQNDEATNNGQIFIAADVTAILPREEIRARMIRFREYVRSIPTNNGRPLVLPGEIEDNVMKQRLQNGIPLPETVYRELNKLAEEYQLHARI